MINLHIFLQGHSPIEAQDVPHEYNVTNLSNGFTVLTESQSFPGAVHMGKCWRSNASFSQQMPFYLIYNYKNYLLLFELMAKIYLI